MPLTAELSVRLNADSLIQGLVGSLTGPSGALNAISVPVAPAQMSTAASASGSFASAPIVAAVSRFASIDLPGASVPATIQRIEVALDSIERLTTSDLTADVTALATQLTTALEQANAHGIPGTLLEVFDLLRGAPTTSALGQLFRTFIGPNAGLGLPAGLGDYLPAFASTLRVLAGLMVYESVLAESERLTAVVASLFSADRARQEAANLQATLQLDGANLASALTSVDPTDIVRVDGLIAAVEHAAAQLDVLEDYLARGMGFGEATLVHLNLPSVQAEIAAAAALLRDPDLGALRRVFESLAQEAEPLARIADPQDAAARGLEQVMQLAEAQADQTAAAIRSLNADVLVTPLTNGLRAITSPLRDVSDLVSQVVTEIRAAVEQVRAAVAALPIDDLVTAIRMALQPVTDALRFIQQLVETIRTALETAANAALEALGDVEHAVDEFKQQIMDLFAQAREFVDSLHLDQVIAGINDQVSAFVALLQQAQMKPYFDTVASGIATAADAIEQVPLELLPESMKADLDAALAPVREVDPDAVETEIESLLQIGPDGTFQLRGDLEQALADLQAKFDALIATLDEHNPRQYVDQLDAQLTALAARIQALTPDLALTPVQDAIAQVKSALSEFDLEQVLQPVQAVFDAAVQSLDQFSPTQLLQPLEDRVTSARQALEAAIHIDQWRPTLDDLATRALALLDVLDMARLEALLRRLLEGVQQEVESASDIGFGRWLGMIVAGLMRGTNLPIDPSSIGSVLRWLGGSAPASAELSARAARMAGSLISAQQQVQTFDPASLSSVVTEANGVRAAASALAAKLDSGSDRRVRLEASANRLQLDAVLGRLTANRGHYLDLVNTAAAFADTVRRTGVSEADVAVAELRQAVAPLGPALQKLRSLAGFLGITGTQGGFGPVIRSVLQVATPARLTGLIVRLVSALRDRFKTLIDQVLTPVRSGIDDLQHLLDLLDLKPIIDGVQAVFQEVRMQILAYSPNVLLHDQLAAFDALKQEVLSFDPLSALLAVLNGLRDTAARVVGKLSAASLLESPLAIYDTIVNAIRQLDIDHLLEPVLDTLDTIAHQVDQGLDETVTAFKRLQDALPPPGGGSSVSVSVGVG